MKSQILIIMIEDFKFPSSYSEVINLDDRNESILSASILWDVDEFTDSSITSKVEALSSTNIEGLAHQDAIDDVVNLIHNLDSFASSNKYAFVEAMHDIASHAIQNVTRSLSLTSVKKNAVKIVVYLLGMLSDKLESSSSHPSEANPSSKSKKVTSKSKDSSRFDGNDWVVKCLPLIQMFLEDVDQSKLWSMGIINDNFLTSIWKLGLKAIENRTSGVSSQDKLVRHHGVQLICACVKHFGSGSGGYSTLSAALLDGLLRLEHVAVSTSDIASKSSHLAKELFQEISQMTMKNISSNGLKHLSLFLETFGKANSSMIISLLPLIMKQIDSSAHQIRSALVTVIGHVILHIHETFLRSTSSEGKNSDDLEALLSTSLDEEDQIVSNEDEVDEKDPLVNLKQLFRTRESLVDILIERGHDMSYFTRATVLKTLATLVDSTAIQVRSFGAVAEVAWDRLKDKTAAVRKAALSLLVNLLDNNPFSSQLNIDSFLLQKNELEKKVDLKIREIVARLKATEVKDEETGDGAAALEAIQEADDEEEREDLPKVTDNLDEWLDHVDVKQDADLLNYRKQLEYLDGALEMIQFLDKSLEEIHQSLIKSKMSSDIVESIKFMKRAVNFHVKDSAKYLQRSFSLIWHEDASIRLECLSAFKDVFLTDGSATSPQALQASEVARNLMELVQRCDVSQMSSLEKIISELFAQEQVDGKVVHELWSLASNPSNGSSIGSALSILAMISKSHNSSQFTSQKINSLSSIIFQERLFETCEFHVSRALAVCIQNIQDIDKIDIAEVSRGLSRVILQGGLDTRLNESQVQQWFASCEEAIHAVFHYHPAPDKFFKQLIMFLYTRLHQGQGNISSLQLAAFVFILGQVASSSLVYFENLSNQVKKTLSSKNSSAEAGTSEVDAAEEEMGLSAANDAEHDKQYTIVVETGLVFHNFLGSFHGMIASIVTSNNSLQSLNRSKYSHHLLRQSSTLALCRYMSISSVICEKYLSLLFTVLERDDGEEVKTSIIVALGDLAFRFPNALEPWTSRIYDRLGDSSLMVRYNTLMVLSHLILHDMVKVKGHVSHIVICLCDESELMRDLATLLFTKLAERSNNPIYNLLGDIIGTLSSSSSGSSSSSAPLEMETSVPVAVEIAQVQATQPPRVLSTKEFQGAMSFLLSFLKKDKQADGLLERLLVRLTMSQSLQQRRNLAFCVSELTVSEKGIKKLLDMIKQIKDALYDTQVFDCIRQMIQKAKKSQKGSSTGAAGEEGQEASTKPSAPPSEPTQDPRMTSSENKGIFEELDKILEAIRLDATGASSSDPTDVPRADAENIPLEDEKPSVKGASRRGATKQPVTKKTSKRVAKKKDWSDDEDDLGQDIDDEPIKTTARSSNRRKLRDVTNQDQEAEF